MVIVMVSAIPNSLANSARTTAPASARIPPSVLPGCRSARPNGPEPSTACPAGRIPSEHPSAGSGTLFAWSELNDLLPTNVSGAGLATDSDLSQAVQFGGWTRTGLSNATQVYDEQDDQWSAIAYGGGPSGGSAPPSARADFGFAGDPADGTAVLFGGNVGANLSLDVNDTWVFNFSTDGWRNVSQLVAPNPRQDPAFAIDPAEGIALLFGGWDPDYQGSGQETFSDTWELNLSTSSWSRIATGEGPTPPALQGAKMDWDPIAGTFDLFGGCYPCSSALWQWDPTTMEWSQLLSPSGMPPSPRMESVWVFDPDLNADVLFGGTNGVSVFGDLSIYIPSDDTWAAEATSRTPAPRAEASADWLAVPGNSTLLMTGGRNANQTYDGTWRLGLAGTVEVVVENGSSNALVPDALVASNLDGTQTTDAAGGVEFTGLPSAELEVNVSAPGYNSTTAGRWVVPGATTTLRVDLAWIPPAIVDTLVTQGGLPVDGARVNLSLENAALGPSEITGPSGWSNRTDVPAFEGIVTAWFPGEHANSTRVDFLSGEVTVVRLTLIPLLELDVVVEGSLPNGTLSPLLNASVTVNDLYFGLTDATGHVVAPTSYAGREVVGASAPYFVSNSSAASLPSTGTLALTIVLTSVPPGYLDLNVFSTETLSLVPNARLTFTETPALPVGPVVFDRVAATGSLLLTLLAGNYTLAATAPGYTVNRSIPLEWITPGQINSLLILLSPVPRAVLDTLVLDNATHRPLAGANVSLEGFGYRTTDALGWANFSSLAADGYTLVASAAGYETNVTGVVLNPGQVVAQFPVNLTPAGSPSGPGGSGDLSLLAPSGDSIWALLLLPLGALALAVLYLTMLRAPEAARSVRGGVAGEPPESPTPTARWRRWFGRAPTESTTDTPP
jgi:Carboxypeptidase regulatory-like domain/Galactose oxidase, central domain